jgi:SAM-dependent methyltransferase
VRFLEKVARLRKEGYLTAGNLPGLVLSVLSGGRQWVTGNGTFGTELEARLMASLRPEKLLSEILAVFAPHSVLDLGCGTGQAVDFFVRAGVEDVLGVENSAAAIRLSQCPERILRHDLRRFLDLGRRFDLVFSFEFLEHVPERYVPTLLETFDRHTDTIVMSAATPGQGGQGHFNEQPPEYWIRKFADQGFDLNEALTRRFAACGDPFCENILVFHRRPTRDTAPSRTNRVDG